MCLLGGRRGGREGHSAALHVVWGFSVLVKWVPEGADLHWWHYVPVTQMLPKASLPPWNVKTNKWKITRKPQVSFLFFSVANNFPILPSLFLNQRHFSKGRSGHVCWELRGKAWWLGSFVIIMGSHGLLLFYLKAVSLHCFPKRSTLPYSLQIGHGKSLVCPSCTWIRKNRKESFRAFCQGK